MGVTKIPSKARRHDKPLLLLYCSAAAANDYRSTSHGLLRYFLLLPARSRIAWREKELFVFVKSQHHTSDLLRHSRGMRYAAV